MLGACANPNPGVDPPGFGDNLRPSLFYPLGIATDSGGKFLYVANSNFDRAFKSGTLLQLDLSKLQFTPAEAGKQPSPVTAESVTARGTIDSFTGEMAINPKQTTLFVTSRDHTLLNIVPLGNNLTLACANADCSSGAIPLSPTPFSMQDPFALKIVPGIPDDFVLVSHLSPASSGQAGIGLDATLAVFPRDAQTGARSSDPANSPYAVDIGAFASSSLVHVPRNNQVFIGGCFQRVTGEQIIPCNQNPSSPFFHTNPIRSVPLGPREQAPVSTANLGTILGAAQTNTLGVSSDGSRLYIATTQPNALLITDLPDPAVTPVPRVLGTVPLSNSPSELVVLPRQGASDLVLLTTTTTNAVLVVDPAAETVLAQIEPISNGPFGIATVASPDPTKPGAPGSIYKNYITLFNACAIAEIDVPVDRPDRTILVGVVASCPCAATGSASTSGVCP